ncbi:MAG: 3-hydroxybutyryl-CoA dehydrogenase [Rhodobacteraceae bacterium]|nr:MAG: 3-hydroxybutyryl-CoA dehydrogenase [Paracoccaceae bacterium]|tara:strand:+ start:3175 stop:4056 length:882 start_codon:yes stop_codon:yes gene_type:complete
MILEIKVVGIIGAGQMGLGIAQVLATSKYEVIINDNNETVLSDAIKVLEKAVHRAMEKGKLKGENPASVINRIKFKSRISDLSKCDLIIEAATEDEQIKHDIFQTLIPHLKPETILTSNTSSISITRLAARTDRPEKFMGCHFMKPAPLMQLVELVRGIATSHETVDVLKKLVKKIGKTSTNSEDFPAFIVNRILMPMINEGIYALYEGVGTVESIDKSMKLGANHPMGPLELADFIGLDTCLAIMNSLHDGLADTKYRPCPLLAKYVEANWLGKKNGMGFYNYSVEPPKPTR